MIFNRLKRVRFVACGTALVCIGLVATTSLHGRPENETSNIVIWFGEGETVYRAAANAGGVVLERKVPGKEMYESLGTAPIDLHNATVKSIKACLFMKTGVAIVLVVEGKTGQPETAYWATWTNSATSPWAHSPIDLSAIGHELDSHEVVAVRASSGDSLDAYFRLTSNSASSEKPLGFSHAIYSHPCASVTSKSDSGKWMKLKVAEFVD